MKFNAIYLISFSPCGHTLTYGRQMAQACSDVIGLSGFQELDITPLATDAQPQSFAGQELAILCAPVYGGRIPVPAVKKFTRLHAQNTPALLLASYGNRHYDDALAEFAEIARSQNFWPIGAAVCVAQHTLASICAQGRPSQADLDSARDFATDIAATLASGAIPQNAVLSVPGNYPFKEFKPFPLPQSVNDNCIMCGQCWSHCPTGAIKNGTPAEIKSGYCIACMGCINICPVGARIPDGNFLHAISNKLAPLCEKPKQNEYFTI